VNQQIFDALGIVIILGGLVLIGSAIYRGVKNLVDNLEKWWGGIVVALLLGVLLVFLGLALVEYTPRGN
jgi:hypothetical protein